MIDDILKNKEIKFEDFKEDYKQLLDKYVLYEYGQTYANKNQKSIRKIIKVTKTGFRINKAKEFLFNFDGRAKGLTSKQDWSTVSICTLITEKEAHLIIDVWNKEKEKKKNIKFINEKINFISCEKIKEIKEMIVTEQLYQKNKIKKGD